MKVISLNTLNYKINLDNLIIGHFNVIHKGHLKLFKNINNLSFLIFINNPNKKYELYNINERIDNLKKYQPEYVLVYDISQDNCSGLEFINKYLKKLNINNIYIGSDFKFGKQRKYDAQFLAKYYKTNIIPNDNCISTTKIIELLQNKKIIDANNLLDNNFYFSGKVVVGRQIARKMFFPTANIINDKKFNLPEGSYVSKTYIDEKPYSSLCFIGSSKSLNLNEKYVESYVFDINQDLYDKHIKIELIDFIRENQKFDNIEQLIQTIKSDLNYAKNYWNKK